jgi:Fe-S cluster biogenesis protein NfuA
MTETVEKRIQIALDKVRPQLQADGGDVEFVAFEKGTVKVRLQGHCAGCPMSMMTLKQGIENFLKKEVPEVKKVEGVQQT